jgi:hypothetical protein
MRRRDPGSWDPRAEASADRKFARQIAAAFGLIFLALAYSGMFADVEMWLVAAGVGMLATGILLWTPAPTAVGALAAPAMTIAILVLLWLDQPG